ncbi:serine esterase, putative [Ichthyophthirius multifiliis]|uniref:Serine esterase, putative n=1 Tax=Ichthyophthirius multifiliis TaxID=5932 RepID=G0QTZ5_ICHMU|nr:serine esterase, putative [Ichthyophthirius multifiliis]EGR31299.1 serine esterase, putative [Ichthyophthirius multifiliis]|eukprot:XP_004034785.1 serine esterase, putative [Ichthyophthirius multifiliis]
MNLLYPECLFLLSVANQQNTEGSIEQMGISLAQEIEEFVKKWILQNQLGKISFVAHSLGGLIVRAALPYLKENYKSKMYTFLSFGVPHLGYLNHQHVLINFGMWFLKIWKGSLCLKQLNLGDDKDIRNCFLYKLSKFEGLEWFRNVVLCSSTQDYYVPLESARIEKIQNDNDKNKNIHNEMVDNLLKNIQNYIIQRLDINFEITERGIDYLIGRKAHILFLELQSLMVMIINNFEYLFKNSDY